MNEIMKRLMAETARLTQSGDLQAATAAIQSALSGLMPGHAPAKDDGKVIDVQARVVDANARQLGVNAGIGGTIKAAIDAAMSGAAKLAATVDPTRAPHVDVPGAPPSPAAPDGSRFIRASHVEGDRNGEYKLFIPPNAEGRALPLVVMLHGCTQDPDDFAAGTRMNEAALRDGFFVLYPEQGRMANPTRCWNWFKHNHQHRGAGEPALIAGMTRAVMAQHGIDPARVYVAGLSAGGAMAAIVGEAYPDLFAAVGVHSGLPVGSASDAGSAFAAMSGGAPVHPASGHAPPTIVFHGDQDTTVAPVNGERVVAASAGGFTPERKLASAGSRDVTRRIWRDNGGKVVAEHWLVHGEGHAWLGGSTNGSYASAHGPNATAEMLRFFFEHRLAAKAH